MADYTGTILDGTDPVVYLRGTDVLRGLSILDGTDPVVYLRGTDVLRGLSILDGQSSVTTYRYNLAGVLTTTTAASTYATAVSAGAITISVRTVTT